MVAELSPEQDRENALSRIRSYALANDLSGEHIVMIFETGIGPVRHLRPDVFGPACAAEKVA